MQNDQLLNLHQSSHFQESHIKTQNLLGNNNTLKRK